MAIRVTQQAHLDQTAALRTFVRSDGASRRDRQDSLLSMMGPSGSSQRWKPASQSADFLMGTQLRRATGVSSATSNLEELS